MSQFGPGAYQPPQAGGFGGSAGGAQPADRARAPSNAPYAQQPQQPHAPSQSSAPPMAQQPGYGPGGYPSYTPAPVSEVPVAAPANKSSRGLVIGAAAAVLVIGIVIAVVATRGGGAKPGLASADEVANKTLAALTAGDVDALIALMGSEQTDKYLECVDGAKQPDPAKALADQRAMLGKITEKSKGLTVELVKLGMAKTTKLEAGKELMPGCKLTTGLAMHDHDFSVKVKSGDKPARDRTYKIALTEIDGRWFLASPPKVERPGDCATAMKQMIASSKADLETKQVGASAILRLERAATQRCIDDAWPDDVVACFEDGKGQSQCAKQLTVDQATKLDRNLATIIEEDRKSREVPAVVDPPTPAVDPTVDPTQDPTVDPTKPVAAGSGSGSAAAEELQIPPICDDYKAEIDKLATCRRIKADIRKAQADRYQLMLDGWNRAVVKTPQMVTSMETICKAGVATLVDLRKTSCR